MSFLLANLLILESKLVLEMYSCLVLVVLISWNVVLKYFMFLLMGSVLSKREALIYFIYIFFSWIIVIMNSNFMQLCLNIKKQSQLFLGALITLICLQVAVPIT